VPIVQFEAARDPRTGQVYVPFRTLVADGSLREPERIQVPAEGVLYSATTFNGKAYGIVDLDCGGRIQALLEPGTDRIGERVTAMVREEDKEVRFAHE
jgi:uncharacterized OB-fold protein